MITLFEDLPESEQLSLFEAWWTKNEGSQEDFDNNIKDIKIKDNKVIYYDDNFSLPFTAIYDNVDQKFR